MIIVGCAATGVDAGEVLVEGRWMVTARGGCAMERESSRFLFRRSIYEQRRGALGGGYTIRGSSSAGLSTSGGSFLASRSSAVLFNT